MFDFFKTDATTERAKNLQINSDTNLVLDYLRDEKIRAEEPENDLLKAIQEARRLLNVFEDKARNEGKTIKNKQIIIMDNGIVTKGDMSFLNLRINRVEFSKLTDGEINKYAEEIAEILERNRVLPELSGVEVVFIGLGDVALPQEELSSSTLKGIKSIWQAVLVKCNVNANNIIFKEYDRGNKANEFLIDGSGFPFVTPITFEKPIIIGPTVISDAEVGFVANRTDFLNPETAETFLSGYAEEFNSYLIQNPDVILYIVGSMAKVNRDRNAPIDLSENRALTIMETLIKYGVPKEKMIAFGLGEFYPNREDEFPRGFFDESIARKNRKVVIIPSNHSEAREVLQAIEQLRRR